MSTEQPRIDEREGRLWLLDRYDNWSMPPGAAAFVLGVDRVGDRPWERKPDRRRHHDDHVAKSRG